MAFIKGFGSYLPERVVPNSEIAARVGCDPKWISEVSGISERRFAQTDESVAAMGASAARDCLRRCSVNASQVGLFIFTTGSGERRFPSPGVEMTHRLSVAGTPVIDLPMASAGSLFGLGLASLLAEAYGEVLVVASEKMSPIVLQEPLDRNTAILFGDGAGAALVSSREGLARIHAPVLHSDGAFAADLRLGLAGSLEMNGPVVVLQSSRKIPGAMREALEAAGVSAQNVDAFLMHQANRNLITRVARALDVPVERFYCNIDRYGNTSSASMFIAAAEWSLSAGFRPGQPVLFAAFGAGFHWGALITAGV